MIRNDKDFENRLGAQSDVMQGKKHTANKIVRNSLAKSKSKLTTGNEEKLQDYHVNGELWAFLGLGLYTVVRLQERARSVVC